MNFEEYQKLLLTCEDEYVAASQALALSQMHFGQLEADALRSNEQESDHWEDLSEDLFARTKRQGVDRGELEEAAQQYSSSVLDRPTSATDLNGFRQELLSRVTASENALKEGLAAQEKVRDLQKEKSRFKHDLGWILGIPVLAFLGILWGVRR